MSGEIKVNNLDWPGEQGAGANVRKNGRIRRK
jgi:hypothetical protein